MVFGAFVESFGEKIEDRVVVELKSYYTAQVFPSVK